MSETGSIATESVSGVLLDIEGTTSSISFVHEVMFPFALEHLDTFLDEKFSDDDAQKACEQVAIDAGHASLASWESTSQIPPKELVKQEVKRLVSVDAKTTGLKALQGHIWASGFESGQLKAHIYDDVLPAIRRWKSTGREVRIYSSGSIAAQKLFFGHLNTSEDSNQLHLLSGHYDTTSGGKKEAASYTNVAEDWGLPPAEILFISDVAEELHAAACAGLQVLASVRPGNKPLPNGLPFASITTFADVLA